MTAEKLTLHRKLAQIMYEAERIPKRGKAPAAMGGFGFVQVGDAADFIRKALAEKVISMLPTAVQIVGQTEHSTKSGGSMTTVDLITTWTLTDGESGESIQIQSFGAGADGGDKYSGKAQTNAMKYALLMGFLLSTGDDPELSNSEDRQARGAESETTPPPKGETEELLGRLTKAGNVKKGTADGYKLEARQGPDGYAIGFRLDIDGERAIPQVLCEGPLGTSLFAAVEGEPELLIGKHVTVKGRLYNVKQAGRQSYYRLRVTHIACPALEFSIPAEEPPAEAESVPLFSDTEAADIAAAVDKAGVA